MAKNEAKIRFTAETGEFNNQIKQSQAEMSKLRAEMKKNDEQMKATGTSVEGLEERQRLLGEQLKVSQQKTEALSQKVDKAKEIYGENSQEVLKLQTQLINAQSAEQRLERQITSCNAELEQQRAAANKVETASEKLTNEISDQQSELKRLKDAYVDVVLEYGETSDEAKDLARQIDSLSGELKDNKKAMNDDEKAADKLDNSLDDVEQGAKDVEDGFSVLDGALSVFVGGMLTKAVEGIGNLVSTFANLSQETQEYREDIVKLKTAFETAGHTTEQATAVYKELYSVFGEEDRAVEAAQQIAKLAENEEQMVTMTTIATGAWAMWGDSLATESLMEAANSTAKIGEVQGTLADALEWCGLNLDEFNERLGEMTTESERSEYILDTLNGLYSDSASLYKKNNDSIIKARKATSDYNDTMADLGETIEPLNTEITKLKNEFAKEFAPVLKKDVIPAVEDFIDDLKDSGTIKDLAKLIGNLAKAVLPPLSKILGFVVENFKTLVIVIGTAVIIYKAFSAAMAITTAIRAATTAVAGLSAGVGVATTVQTAWNAAMVSNPIGALVSAIGLLVGGIVLLANTQGEAVDSTDELSESQRIAKERTEEAAEAANEAAEAFRNQRKSYDESVTSINSQYGHIETLKTELLNLADAEGTVDEKNHSRAQFILNELNNALGTEYTMTGNVISQYQTLASEIDKVIEKKKATLLLEATEESYVTALQGKAQAETDYYTNYKALIDAQQEYEWAYLMWIKDVYGEESVKIAKENLEKRETAYNNSKEVLGGYYEDIGQYETASMLTLEGKTEEAAKVLSDREYYVSKYADSVGFAHDEVNNTWEQEAIDAGVKAALIRKNWENGVAGYTEEMVIEAEENYQNMLDKMEGAYDDAKEVGGDLTNGLKKGMENGETSLFQKAKNMVRGIIASFKEAADSHSPSKKMIAFGEDLGEGGKIGLENKTKSFVKTARNQAQEVMEAYDVLDFSSLNFGFDSLNKNIGGKDFTIQHQAYLNTADAIESKLQISGFGAYIKAVEDLANRAINLNINGQKFATATAGDTDTINGDRLSLSRRGLAL